MSGCRSNPMVASAKPVMVASAKPVMVASAKPVMVARAKPVMVARAKPVMVARAKPGGNPGGFALGSRWVRAGFANPLRARNVIVGGGVDGLVVGVSRGLVHLAGLGVVAGGLSVESSAESSTLGLA